jgi:HEAT repeat protein
MSNREIGVHLGLLAALVIAAFGLYRYEMSPLVVPRLIRWLDSGDAELAGQAAERLEALGAPAESSAPTLARVALDSSNASRIKAAQALPSVDLSAATEVARHYRSELRADDVDRRRRAAEILGAIGPVATEAVPDLIVAASDADAIVRDRAIQALARIGIPTAAILPTLIRSLDDAVPHVRHAALAAFAFDVPASVARQAEAAVRQHVTDEPMNAVLVQSILGRLATERADITVRVCIDLLANSEASVRAYQLRQLAMIGADAASAAPAIARRLTDESPLNRYLAAQALSSMGPAATDATPALTAALQDRDPVVRPAVANALRSIGEAR